MPQIEVEFDIDANGILHVTAKDKTTGREQRLLIQPTSGLSEQDIQRMVREAEQHASEDARRREEAEVRNQADNLAYRAERLLQESGDQLPADTRSEIDAETKTLRHALDQNDVPAMRSSMQRLEQFLATAGQAAYAASGAPGGASPGGQSAGGEEPGTVEGEYREV
jgi:molecular chaperone DnaK